MNGIEPNDLLDDNRRNDLCDTILADASAKFGYEKESLLHPTEPMLSKHWYTHSTGTKETNSSVSKTRIQEQNENAIELKSWTDVMAPKAEATLAIKLENPRFSQLQEKISVLTSARKQLEKQQSEGDNIAAKLKAKAAKDSGLKKTADDMLVIPI